MTQFRRSVPSGLVTLFAESKTLVVADLYTITLAGGQVLRWTDIDAPVKISGTTWICGPGLEREFLELQAGVDTQSTEFTVTDDGRTLVNGVSLLPFMLAGGFDGATCTIHQAYAGMDGVWVDKLERFTGQIGPVETLDRLQLKVTLLSITEIFNRPLPPSVFGPQCENNLYDSVCAVDRNSYLVHGTTSGPASGGRLVVPHGLTQAAGWFGLGTILFTTGANAGVRRTVRLHGSGTLTLMQPLPSAGTAGDAFDIWPGCDRVRDSDCANKFNNKGRFRGEPHVPPPETIL